MFSLLGEMLSHQEGAMALGDTNPLLRFREGIN